MKPYLIALLVLIIVTRGATLIHVWKRLPPLERVVAPLMLLIIVVCAYFIALSAG